MYYISSILNYNKSNEIDLTYFLDDMISRKILKSFYVVKHFDYRTCDLHFHFYFEFFNKKLFYENYGLFCAYGFLSFYKRSFYVWLSSVDNGMHFFDKNNEFSFDFFIIKP